MDSATSVRDFFLGNYPQHATCPATPSASSNPYMTTQRQLFNYFRLLTSDYHRSCTVWGWGCIAAISLHLIFFTRANRRPAQFDTVTSLKVCTAILLALKSLILSTYDARDGYFIVLNYPDYFLMKLNEAGLFGILALLMTLDRRRRSVGMSIPLLAYWSGMMILTSGVLYFHVVSNTGLLRDAEIIATTIQLLGVLLILSLSLISDTPESKRTRYISSKKIHPEESATWWSNLTLSWVTSIAWTGFRRKLEEEDIADLSPKDRSSMFDNALERAWNIEHEICQGIRKSHASQKCVNGKTNTFLDDTQTNLDTDTVDEGTQVSLLKVLFRAYGLRFFSLHLFKTIFDIGDLSDPLLIALLMNHIQNRQDETAWDGALIVLSIFVMKYILHIGEARTILAIDRLSGKIQIGINMAVFKKSLLVRNECVKDQTNGEIVHLMSHDCNDIISILHELPQVLAAPLQIGIPLYFLYYFLGWSMLFGVALMCLLIPLSIFIGRTVEKTIRKKDKFRLKRVKIMSEIINGIRFLKLYAWEKCFMEKVDKIRSEEINYGKKEGVLEACTDSIFRMIPLLIQCSAFGVFLLLGGHLDAKMGFVTFALIQDLNGPISMLALALPEYLETYVSLKRINDYLNKGNISPKNITKISDGPSAVRIKGGFFTWERSKSTPTLANVNVDIPKGSLTAVVGMVGSGKSTLLSSMLGATERLKGQVEIQGRLAYVPQEAWILNASLKENVLFGSNLDKELYREIIHVSCLEDDINAMSAGDETEIGEKGINLSGGQKQRVSFARGIYNGADVYLLDDPLSAVDVHVGKHIFNKVIGHKGILNGKTRVLVTHGIQWLPYVDTIIVMKDGQVSETGTFEQLISNDGAFAQLLRFICSHSSDDEEMALRKMKKSVYNRLNSGENENNEEQIEQIAPVNHTSPTDRSESIKDVSENNGSSESNSESDGGESDDNCNDNNSNGTLIAEEMVEYGFVKKDIYFEYLKAVGFKSVLLVIGLLCVTIAADYYGTYTVTLWTDDPLLENKSKSDTKELSSRSWHYYNIFVICGIIEIASAFLYVISTTYVSLKASSKMHDNLLNAIMKCPSSFFDTTPSSRVITRFSRDISVIDEFGNHLKGSFEHLFVFITCTSLIVTNAPVILLCLVPMILVYFYLHRIHVSTVLQLRRYISKYQSPIELHFSETLNGMSSIRAYGCQRRFIEKMETSMEQGCKFASMGWAVRQWFTLRMSYIYLFINMVTCLVVVFDKNMTAGLAVLMFMYANDFSNKLEDMVERVTNMESEITSLERVLDYTSKPSEAPWEILETSPAADWPRQGHVVFKDFKTRYRKGLDFVLKGINCEIKDGEKIGIVGRTGAGKTSLTMALFRLMEASSGYIEVDDKNIAELGLHSVRRNITILPQEPIIFAGTLRMNLDPFDKATNDELWAALQQSHLKSFVESLPGQLDFECGEGGKNLSCGQRQLVCLARTLLRRTRILILDEATAAVDMETDERIQETIRTEFKDCTVLTIAHRLNTIMDYDRILVLEEGLVKEFDSPSALLSDKRSLFYSMAKDAKLVT